MSTEIQVDKDRVVIGLGRLGLGLRETDQLMRTIGASQLASIRRTFREQGSPAGSWTPLSPNTIRRNPRRYGPGHKLLIGSSRLLNSIGWETFPGGVRIGTNLVYARVHQRGSADRKGAAIGPQARIAGRSTRRGRFQNIPPRPYVVFRPEDPARINDLAAAFVNRRISEAGLQGGAQ